MDKEARQTIGEAIGLGLLAGWFVFWISNSATYFWITVLVVAALVWSSQSSQASTSSEKPAPGAVPGPKAQVTPKVSICPCGCGRTVGVMQRGLIQRYELIIRSQPTFAFAASRAIDSVVDPQMKHEIARALENGERARQDALLHLHGQARPGVALDMHHLNIALDAYFDWGYSMMRYAGIEIPASWS